MRKILFVLAALAAAAPAPPPACAAEGGTPASGPWGAMYFFGHIGMFDPKDDVKEFDTGLALDAGVGSKVTPNVAVDATLGFFNSDSDRGKVVAFPLTFGGRYLMPYEFLEPYLGAGVGFYPAKLDRGPVGDTAVGIGGYLSGGIDARLTAGAALNLEVKRHFARPEFDGNGTSIGGWTLMMGARFAF